MSKLICSRKEPTGDMACSRTMSARWFLKCILEGGDCANNISLSCVDIGRASELKGAAGRDSGMRLRSRA